MNGDSQKEAEAAAWWRGLSHEERLGLPSHSAQDHRRRSAPRVTLTQLTAAVADMGVGDQRSFSVRAVFDKAYVEHGPLFYRGCSNVLDGGRTCRKELDAAMACPRCGDRADWEPVLKLNRGRFSDETGGRVRATAFGDVAATVLGIDGERARRLEAQAVARGEPRRESTARAISGATGRTFELGIDVEACGVCLRLLSA